MIDFDPILVHEWLARSAQRHPDRPALICGKERWTYDVLNNHTAYLAAKLMSLGMQRHDRVAILTDNSAETVISIYATLKAGGAFVVLTSSIKGPKLSYILNNCRPRFLIVHTSKAQAVSEAWSQSAPDTKLIWVGDKAQIPSDLSEQSISWSDLFPENPQSLLTYPAEEHIVWPRTLDVDLATLIYTSGSTGEPKGVMSTHHNMISAARSIIQYIGNEPDDIILDVLPLSFDYGLYQVIMTFMFGGTVVLENSFLYLHNVLQRISQERVTGFPIVPTVVAMLLKRQDVSQYDFSSLRYITNTGAALPVDHIQRLRELLPQTSIYSMFGLTECKRVSYMPPDQLDQRPASVGTAMPNCETRVVDEADQEVPAGQTGELVIRGSNVMQGYWNDADLTAKAYQHGQYPADRILRSGDYFHQDEDGFLYFLGRKDDMIKSKGERISAKEVENILHAMEEIAEAAVIGIPDEIYGQVIQAFIVCAPGSELTEQAVLKYCSTTMETYMVPKYVQFLAELPRTPNGKIDKKQLAAMEASKPCISK